MLQGSLYGKERESTASGTVNAGFEDRKGPGVKGHGQPLETGDGRKYRLSPDLLKRNTVLTTP